MHYLGLSCFLYDKNYHSTFFINTYKWAVTTKCPGFLAICF